MKWSIRALLLVMVIVGMICVLGREWYSILRVPSTSQIHLYGGMAPGTLPLFLCAVQTDGMGARVVAIQRMTVDSSASLLPTWAVVESAPNGGKYLLIKNWGMVEPANDEVAVFFAQDSQPPAKFLLDRNDFPGGSTATMPERVEDLWRICEGFVNSNELSAEPRE